MAEYDDILSLADRNHPDFRWTPKRLKFVHHFARTSEVGKSAQMAGFKDPAYGTELLKERPIRDRIAEEVHRLLVVQGESEESVIERWIRWANVKPTDYFEPGWQIKDVSELTDDQARCIKKVTIREHQHGRDVNLEFYSSEAANEKLAQMLGILGQDGNMVAPPEETAKNIKKLLEEMKERDAVEAPRDIGQPH